MLVLYTESELARSSNFYGATQNYVTREEWKGKVIFITSCYENLMGKGVIALLLYYKNCF